MKTPKVHRIALLFNANQIFDHDVTADDRVMREPDRIVRLKTVLARTGLSRSTVYRKIAEGTFPTQLKISTNGSGWHESDINRWIADPVGWCSKDECDEGR
jgi:prophage regulatory protein